MLVVFVIWVGQVSQLVINLMCDVLFDSGVIQGDEMNVQVFKELGCVVQLKSVVWVQMNVLGLFVWLYSYVLGYYIEYGDQLWVGMCEGVVLMSDGGVVYDVIVKKNGLVYFGCWMYVCCYFVEFEEVIFKEV